MISHPPRLLLTGPPGCGKSTVIERTLKMIHRPAGGFLTREVRNEGVRQGFMLETLDGRTALLAHRDFPYGPRVGRYRVDVRALDEIGVPAIYSAIKRGLLVVIDEIGPMELLSAAFRKAVTEAFASSAPLLIAIAERPHPFAEPLKATPNVIIFPIQRGSRDRLPAEVAAALEATYIP